MGVKILSGADSKTFNYSGRDDSSFLICDGQGDFVEVYTPLALDDAFETDDFDVYFLIKKGVGENDIFQVYTGGVRIGWCIPVNALGSDLHDYAEDPHFLKYAFKGVEVALRSASDSVYMVAAEADGAGRVNFSNLFHPYTVLLVISKSTISDTSPFDFNRCLPSLVKFGYQPLTTKNPAQMQHVGIAPKGRRMRLLLASEDVDNYQMIVSIMTSVLAYEGNAVFRFFYIYQIFELLIENILRMEQEEVIDRLYEVKSDPAKSREILKNLKEMIGEQERIRLLVTKYSNCAGEAQEVRRSCHDFLRLLGVEAGTGFEEFFYPIRNFMVHRLRELSDANAYALADVVLHTVDYIPRILSGFNVSHRADALPEPA